MILHLTRRKETPTTQPDPVTVANNTLHDIFRTSEDDLKLLDAKHNEILKNAIDYNKELTSKLRKDKSDPTIQEPKDVNEVVVWGDIVLTEDKLELLNLGPGYMIVSDLNREEMMVEENVTMTKICWSRMRSGDDELTGKQIDKQANENTDRDKEAEEQDELEIEMRDVISTNGKEVDMR